MPCYSFEGVIPVVAHGAYVHPTAVLIGDVLIGPGCYIGPNAVLRGDCGRVVVPLSEVEAGRKSVHAPPLSLRRTVPTAAESASAKEGQSAL